MIKNAKDAVIVGAISLLLALSVLVPLITNGGVDSSGVDTVHALKIKTVPLVQDCSDVLAALNYAYLALPNRENHEAFYRPLDSLHVEIDKVCMRP